MIVRAPAKLNLCLYLGPRRGDGLHELCSLTEALTLSDRLALTDADRDEVHCPGVEGPNLVADALRGLRERGWSRPPLRVEIEKRIPVAAGLGGGSADAAAVLRLARGEVAGVEELAAEIGADVPTQLEPGLALVEGAGERVEPLPAAGEHAFVLIPSPQGLSTAEVFAEADRLGLGRDAAELASLAERVRATTSGGGSPLAYGELLVNDLQRAALSLRPGIDDALRALERAGAEAAIITGSGPTAFGLFSDMALADQAASSLPPRYADAIVAAPAAR